MLRIGLVTIAMFASGAAIAQAQNLPAETPEQRKACADDASYFCGEFAPDRGRIYQCLRSKVREISLPCRKVVSGSVRRRARH